jgi:hypothetical protein
MKSATKALKKKFHKARHKALHRQANKLAVQAAISGDSATRRQYFRASDEAYRHHVLSNG